ncbi:MAG: NAD-dependent epimerase/dehydratase family protein [Thermaerobacterales bacterium]
MRVLVTGGAGFIGSHLVDALIHRGDEVRVLDNLDLQAHGGRLPDYLNSQAEYRFGDLRDADTVAAALEDVDAVSHQASRVGIAHSLQEIRKYTDANVMGTATLIEEMVRRRDQIRQVVVASSMSVYGEGRYECPECGQVDPPPRAEARLAEGLWEVPCPHCGETTAAAPTPEAKAMAPQSVYAINKRDQEELTLVACAAYGLPAVALRYSNIYGRRQALSNPYTGVVAIFISRLLNDRAPVVFEDGSQLRDLTHVDDAVQANLLALDPERPPTGVFNVGAGCPVTVGALARTLATVLDRAIEPEITGEYRRGDTRHFFTDTDRIQTTLGFRAQVGLKEGLADLVDWAAHRRPADRFGEALAELRRLGLTGDGHE